MTREYSYFEEQIRVGSGLSVGDGWTPREPEPLPECKDPIPKITDDLIFIDRDVYIGYYYDKCNGNPSPRSNLFVSKDLQVDGNVYVSGISTFIGNVDFKGGTNGSIIFGDTSGDSVIFKADVDSNIIPNINNTYDLGSTTQKWKDGYFSGAVYGNINSDNINVGFASITNANIGIATIGFATITDANIGIATIGFATITDALSVAGTLGISEVGGSGNRTTFTSSPGGFVLNHNDNSDIFFNSTNINRLRFSYVSNYWNTPSDTGLLVGTATSTGTASQPLQVSGGAYVSGSVGVGTTEPTFSSYNTKFPSLISDTNTKLSVLDGNVTILGDTGNQNGAYTIGPYVNVIGIGTISTTSGDTYPSYNVSNYSNTYYSTGELGFYKSGLTSAGIVTTCSTDFDTLGTILSRAYSGTRFENAAFIQFELNSRNITGSGNHPSADIAFYGRNSSNTGQYGGNVLGRFEGDTGNFSVTGRIIPSVGSAANRGIEWTSDPGGGSGDVAFIKYYVDGAGEDTRLHIGIRNDANDDLYLEAISTTVTGSLSKASGSFRIPHPLPELSETHNLVHSFIEGPRADLIYRGKVFLVDGVAEVNLDEYIGITSGTWDLLCRDPQVFLQNNMGWCMVRGFVLGNILFIESQDITCNDEIDWCIIAERKDSHMYDTGWTDDNGRPILEPLQNKKFNLESS